MISSTSYLTTYGQSPLFPLLRLGEKPRCPSTAVCASLIAEGKHYYHLRTRKRRVLQKFLAEVSPDNKTVVTEPTATKAVDDHSSVVPLLVSASDIVKNFYGGINSRDLVSVEDLIAQDCIYEDLVFPRPFVGRKAILEFFQKFVGSISKELQFVIDDISAEDSSRVGVTWHLEWKGQPFPFSKGCSFYRLEVISGKRQIVYGRDSVEPAMKPGETALVAIRGVTWLLERFPQLADRL